MEHNVAGFIFFLTAVSITYVWMTGIAKAALEPDPVPGAMLRLFRSLVTLPALGFAISLSYPHYEIGLVSAGLILGFVMTLNSISHGLTALSTEPFAIGIMSLIARRSGV